MNVVDFSLFFNFVSIEINVIQKVFEFIGNTDKCVNLSLRRLSIKRWTDQVVMKPLHFFYSLQKFDWINAKTLGFFGYGDNVVSFVKDNDGIVEYAIKTLSNRFIDDIIIRHEHYVCTPGHASHFVIWTKLFIFSLFSMIFG